MYEKLIENWRIKPNETSEQFPWKITDSIYKQNLDKVCQFFPALNLFPIDFDLMLFLNQD